MMSDRTFVWAAGLFAGLFVLSLGLYFLLPGRLTRTVLTFPHEISRQFVPEARSLPFNWDTEHNAELLVSEVLLGPARHDHLRLFSRQAAVHTVLYRNGKVWIDLTKGSFIPDPDVIYSPVKALEVLKRTLKDNIPDVTEVFVTVGGEPADVNHVDKG